jgi:hypothetical protein
VNERVAAQTGAMPAVSWRRTACPAEKAVSCPTEFHKKGGYRHGKPHWSPPSLDFANCASPAQPP